MLALFFPAVPVGLLFVLSWWLNSALHHEVAAGLAARALRPPGRAGRGTDPGASGRTRARGHGRSAGGPGRFG